MRSFIASCLIFALLIAGVAVNQHYVRVFTAEMTDHAERLPDSPTEKESALLVQKMERLCEEKHLLLSLSVPASRLERIERTVRTLRAAQLSGSSDDYLAARAELLLYLERLRETELFSLRGLL